MSEVFVASDAAIIVKEGSNFDDSRFNVQIFGLQFFGTVLIVGVQGCEYCDLLAPEIWVKIGEIRNGSS